MAVQNLSEQQQAEVRRLCGESEFEKFARWEQTLVEEAMNRVQFWFVRGQWGYAMAAIDKASKHQRAIAQYRNLIKARNAAELKQAA